MWISRERQCFEANCWQRVSWRWLAPYISKNLYHGHENAISHSNMILVANAGPAVLSRQASRMVRTCSQEGGGGIEYRLIVIVEPCLSRVRLLGISFFSMFAFATPRDSLRAGVRYYTYAHRNTRVNARRPYRQCAKPFSWRIQAHALVGICTHQQCGRCVSTCNETRRQRKHRAVRLQMRSPCAIFPRL